MMLKNSNKFVLAPSQWEKNAPDQYSFLFVLNKRDLNHPTWVANE